MRLGRLLSAGCCKSCIPGTCVPQCGTARLMSSHNRCRGSISSSFDKSLALAMLQPLDRAFAMHQTCRKQTSGKLDMRIVDVLSSRIGTPNESCVHSATHWYLLSSRIDTQSIQGSYDALLFPHNDENPSAHSYSSIHICHSDRNSLRHQFYIYHIHRSEIGSLIPEIRGHTTQIGKKQANYFWNYTQNSIERNTSKMIFKIAFNLINRT